VSRFPIRVRLALAFALVMAVVFSAVGAFLYVRLGETLDDRIAENLDGRTTTLASTLEASSPLVAGQDGVAQVLGADGSVIAASRTVGEESLLSSQQLERARIRSITFEREMVSDGSNVDFRLRATPVGGRIVVVGEPLDDRDDALNGLLAQLLIVLPIALLVSSVVGYFVAGAALRPVEAMRTRATEISADTPEHRLPLPRAHDEVRRLGETLNEMLDRLDAGLARERRFVADASHELRTPLASLRTELELAKRRPRSHEELASAVTSAGEEVERLVRLADDLLTLARTDEGRMELSMERHEVRPLLEAVAERNDSRASTTDRSLEVSAPVDSTVTADRMRLEQALGNLVDNALRYGSGTVWLEARVENGWVALSVLDEGIGFPPAFLPHAFERFSRAEVSRAGSGAGLGLAIVDAIARAHGGSAIATNRADGGAQVTLEIPAPSASE
jgi:signal transduction histidine kinase